MFFPGLVILIGLVTAFLYFGLFLLTFATSFYVMVSRAQSFFSSLFSNFFFFFFAML